ncbi:ABC transporter ATP-binding protein, partial [Aliarcobacter butzleri]
AMSTGQLRKCIVGRALIHDPKAMVLDEATGGVDIKAQKNFIKMLKKLALRSSITLVTHHLEEVFEEIENVALVYTQTIYKSGKKEDILSSENLSEIFETKLTLK